MAFWLQMTVMAAELLVIIYLVVRVAKSVALEDLRSSSLYGFDKRG